MRDKVSWRPLRRVEGCKDLLTHASVAESHSAGFAFAKEKETAIGLNEGRADAIFSPAAHFTGVVRICNQEVA